MSGSDNGAGRVGETDPATELAAARREVELLRAQLAAASAPAGSAASAAPVSAAPAALAPAALAPAALASAASVSAAPVALAAAPAALAAAPAAASAPAAPAPGGGPNNNRGGRPLQQPLNRGLPHPQQRRADGRQAQQQRQRRTGRPAQQQKQQQQQQPGRQITPGSRRDQKLQLRRQLEQQQQQQQPAAPAPAALALAAAMPAATIPAAATPAVVAPQQSLAAPEVESLKQRVLRMGDEHALQQLEINQRLERRQRLLGLGAPQYPTPAVPTPFAYPPSPYPPSPYQLSPYHQPPNPWAGGYQQPPPHQWAGGYQALPPPTPWASGYQPPPPNPWLGGYQTPAPGYGYAPSHSPMPSIEFPPSSASLAPPAPPALEARAAPLALETPSATPTPRSVWTAPNYNPAGDARQAAEERACNAQLLAEAEASVAEGRRRVQEMESRRDQDDSCYVLLEDDGKNGRHYVWNLLLTLPDMIIESLIKNTLPYDYHSGTEVEFKTFVQEEMHWTSTPGIYLNLPNWGKVKGGKCLNARQMDETTSSVKIYFEDHLSSRQANEDIDVYFSGSATVERRYGDTRASEIAKEWISRIEKMYLNHSDDDDDQEPFTHCAGECGWGGDMRNCASEHTNNKSTNYLFGVYNVVTRKHGYPEPMQLSLFSIWENNLELCRVAEIVGHILCSTYWLEGGLNPSWAGNFGESTASNDQFARNKTALGQRLGRYGHLYNDKSKHKEFRDRFANYDPTAKQRAEDAKEKSRETRAEAEEHNRLVDEWTEIQDERREIIAKLEAHRDQRRPKPNVYNPEIEALNNAAAKLAKSREDRLRAKREELANLADESSKPE